MPLILPRSNNSLSQIVSGKKNYTLHSFQQPYSYSMPRSEEPNLYYVGQKFFLNRTSAEPRCLEKNPLLPRTSSLARIISSKMSIYSVKIASFVRHFGEVNCLPLYCTIYLDASNEMAFKSTRWTLPRRWPWFHTWRRRHGAICHPRMQSRGEAIVTVQSERAFWVQPSF